jgi:hypothetical protein
MDDATRLVHSIRRQVAIASPIGRTVGRTRPALGMGMGMGLLRLIWDEFYHHAPQNTAPGS